MLDECRRHLSMETGIVARIQKQTYEIFAVRSNANVFAEGDLYSHDFTICGEVVQTGRTIAVDCQNNQPRPSHPLYDPDTLRTYIGTPLTCDGKTWGTLNFTSFINRKKPFHPEEIAFVEQCAEKLSRIISEQHKHDVFFPQEGRVSD